PTKREDEALRRSVKTKRRGSLLGQDLVAGVGVAEGLAGRPMAAVAGRRVVAAADAARRTVERLAARVPNERIAVGRGVAVREAGCAVDREAGHAVVAADVAGEVARLPAREGQVRPAADGRPDASARAVAVLVGLGVCARARGLLHGAARRAHILGDAGARSGLTGLVARAGAR